MDIINYVLDIPQDDDNETILNYKKQQLGIMLEEFFRMEEQYKENQKIIFHSRIPHNFKYFHTGILDYVSRLWSNISYLNDSLDQKKKIDKLHSEIIIKDKNYIHPLMKKKNHIHDKISTLKAFYGFTFLILIIAVIAVYKALRMATISLVTRFREGYANSTYLTVRFIVFLIVFHCCLGCYYYLFDFLWWCLKALLNFFIWFFKAFLYIVVWIIIAFAYLLKFIIMGSILICHAVYQLGAIIVKFCVALPATIENIFKFGDASLVIDEINFDLDMSYSMDSMGLEVLDTIDTWLSFEWLELALGEAADDLLKNFGRGLTRTTGDYKNFVGNVNNDLRPVGDKSSSLDAANNKLQEEQLRPVSQCTDSSFVQKMIISANRDKKSLSEEKEKIKSGRKTFVKCISS